MPETSFYYLKLTFTSTNPDWAARYLENREYRLTYVLRDLQNAFWENFAAQRRVSLSSQQLLLRTKHVVASSREVVLSQIYRDRSGYETFLREACGEHDLARLLQQRGISMKKEDSMVDPSFGPELVASVLTYPHIIQYIREEWKTPGMLIGDPLKQGRLYLPNLDEK